jgi:ABC-type glycerol-3-phosphate transport system permease component
MAGSTVSVLPPIVLFLLFQKRIISGITIGSVKGA